LRGNAGEFGDCVAAGRVVNSQAVADQAQRLHGMRGVAEGLLDVEQKRDQVCPCAALCLARAGRWFPCTTRCRHGLLVDFGGTWDIVGTRNGITTLVKNAMIGIWQ
jgi:hypothetical protein